MTENAVPTRTERPSPRRAPTTVSATAAAAASPALMAIGRKCTSALMWTSRGPRKCRRLARHDGAGAEHHEQGDDSLPQQTVHVVSSNDPARLLSPRARTR